MTIKVCGADGNSGGPPVTQFRLWHFADTIRSHPLFTLVTTA